MNIITEMKTTLDGTNSRLDEEEDHITNMKDKVVENTQSEWKIKKKNPNVKTFF